MLAQKV
jgi:hypothetical protein